jgi:predicted RNase H-like HicB family nuclease
MLIQYIQAAMRQAKYEQMENGRFFARIPKCKGVWGEGRTLEQCREDLKSALQDWIVVKLRFEHKLPVVDGIDINLDKALRYAEAR